MITEWMLYALVISGVVAGVVAALAYLLRRWGRPERFAWAGGLVTAVALPLLAPFWRAWQSAGAPSEAASGAAGTGTLGLPTYMGVPESPLVVSADPWVLLAWAAVSVALLSRAAVRGVRLVRELRAADSGASGRGTLISRTSTLGPGVTGLRRPRILLPEWLRELPRGQRCWVVRHEVEHLRASDLWLHHAALAVRMILPWNLATSFLALRLQRALETDCDRRVLRGRSDGLRSYGETLISVARARPQAALALGTFNERLTSLEHRIRTMTRPSRPWNPLRTSLAALLVPAGLLVACEVPSPTGIQPPRGPRPAEAPPTADTPETRDPADGPTFTPYTVAPDIQNRPEVMRALAESYPTELRESGVSGTANVWFFIGEDGRTRDVRIQQSSGVPELDDAALSVARVMEFSPATNRDQPVPVWVAFPITFRARSATEGTGSPQPAEEQPYRTIEDREPGTPEDATTGAGAPRPLGEYPDFTPYTVAPDIANRVEVVRALEREYPAEMRENGVSGTTSVWFFIDETGTLRDVRVQRSSGVPELDQAALRVARVMEFTPARNRETPVPVWVAFPITFQIR